MNFEARTPAQTYALVDSTTGETLFDQGTDFGGVGIGPTAAGLLPVVTIDSLVRIDPASDWTAPPTTNANLKVSYQPVLSPNLRRPGYPVDFEIRFASTVKDTGLALFPAPARPAKFEVFALEPEVRARWTSSSATPTTTSSSRVWTSASTS